MGYTMSLACPVISQILSNKARIIVDLQSNLTPWASAALQVGCERMCDIGGHTLDHVGTKRPLSGRETSVIACILLDEWRLKRWG
jgi:hypothetical protein